MPCVRYGRGTMRKIKGREGSALGFFTEDRVIG